MPYLSVLARHWVVPATGNAYILLHHTIYFNGNGTSQVLAVLLTYLVVSAVILGVLNLRRSEPRCPPTSPRPQPDWTSPAGKVR